MYLLFILYFVKSILFHIQYKSADIVLNFGIPLILFVNIFISKDKHSIEIECMIMPSLTEACFNQTQTNLAILNEPPNGKTNNLPSRKQRRRSASQ